MNYLENSSDFLFYSSDDGTIKVHVIIDNETVWLTQEQMATLFGKAKSTVNEHIKNIYEENELEESSTMKKFGISEFQQKAHNYYNLDVIISVGYRVKSYQGTKFRQWATSRLREYLVNGFALDDERLKQGSVLFGKDNFEELLERIREIRASERLFYQKITDIYSTSSDYDSQSPITKEFYATVQNKLHWAIHKHTAAELIAERADSNKPNMGLTSWKNEKKGGKAMKSDVIVAKNYLHESEIKELNRVVTMYLDFAENMAMRHKDMKMQDWAKRLDAFLDFNEYGILKDAGKISKDVANSIAEKEYQKFRVIQDREYKSDFDKVVIMAKEKQFTSERNERPKTSDHNKRLKKALVFNPKDNSK